MPREQITYPSAKPFMIDSDGNELELTANVPARFKVLCDPELHVNWMPESSDLGGHVQLSLNMEAVFLKHRAAGLTDDVSHAAIYTPTLSRQELNKLIRVLRVARDKAYGRDE